MQYIQQYPDLIPLLCILYYDSDDKFQIIGEGITYTENNKTSIIKLSPIQKSRCYGSIIIPSNINCVCLGLKVINVPTDDHTCIAVGISSIDGGTRSRLGRKFYIRNYRGVRIIKTFKRH